MLARLLVALGLRPSSREGRRRAADWATRAPRGAGRRPAPRGQRPAASRPSPEAQYRANEVRFNELLERCVLTGPQIAALVDAFNGSYAETDPQACLATQRKVLAALARAANWSRTN